MLTFSDDVATTTCVQPSSAKSPSPESPPSGLAAVHAGERERGDEQHALPPLSRGRHG